MRGATPGMFTPGKKACGVFRSRLERLAPGAPPAWEWAHELDAATSAVRLRMVRHAAA